MLLADVAPPATFGFWDWLVLIVYFVSCIGIGLWMSRRVRTTGSYFLGDRKFPWWIMIGMSFSSGTHAEGPVAQAGATCRDGFSAMWYQWKNMLITPFYWLMSPWYRRSERTTSAEIVEDRYGPGMGLAYTIFAIAFFVCCQGTMLLGAAKVIAVATGGNLVSQQQVIWGMAIGFVAYSFLGGMLASAYNNFIQGLLIIVLSFMLIPAGLHEVGGFHGMRELLPAGFFSLFGAKSQMSAFAIAMLAINGLVGVCAQPHILSVNATGSSERNGRIGQTYGTLIKRLCTIGWALTGLIVAAMIAKSGAALQHNEDAFGYACLHLLGPGFVGLLVACVLAANMAACSTFLVNSGALFTRNLYQPFVRPNAVDKELLWVGRISGVALTALGIAFALKVKGVLDAFMFTETLAALFGVMFFGGFLWRRANRYGAAASVVASCGVYFGGCLYISRDLANDAAMWQQGIFSWLVHVAKTGTLLPAPWPDVVFGWTMLAGFGALALVSLLTPAESPELIANFFDKMERSTDKEGMPDGKAKPLAAELGQGMLMLDLGGWFTARRWRGFFQRYREDLIGFVIAWGVVGLLVLFAWSLMLIGK